MTAVATIHQDRRGRISVTPITPRICRRLSRDIGICWGDVVIAETRVPVRAVYERITAGESIGDVALDYNIRHADVRACIALMSESRRRHQSAERVFDRWATKGGTR